MSAALAGFVIGTVVGGCFGALVMGLLIVGRGK